MKKILLVFCALLVVTSCENSTGTTEPHHENFQKRTVNLKTADSLESGKSYLSVYSQIYSLSEHKIHNLTVTASIRNMNSRDTLFITKAEYFDTHGKSISDYLVEPVYVAPMETLEIVIDEVDQEGGTGANFIFDWKIKPNSTEPFFEGVMISTYGTQGLSFTTQGKRIE